MRKTGLLCILSILLCAPSVGALASSATPATESHQAILDTARGFLERELKKRPGRSEIHLGGLDRRMRLARCDRPLEGYLPPGGRLAGNTSVGVRCTGTTPWKLYVSARVAVIEKVVITRGFLARGTVIGPEHVALAEREVTGSGYIKRLDDVLGQVVKQPVQDGLIVNPSMIERPRLVRRGDEVTILSQGGAFEVRMRGSALGDGAEGDRIRVRNLNSKRIVEGEVMADGAIRVQM